MVLVKINYASVSPIIKITYDETPVYIKTSVNNVYAKVVYGTSIKWGDIEGTLSDQTDLQNALDDKVPYTGATANVDLGEYELKAGQLTLDVSPTGTASVGTTRWNNTIGSSETTLKGGSVVLKNGVDLVARIVNKVTPNTTLTKAAYQAVRISGAQGQRLAVAFAQANNDNNSADTIGLVTETIATNQEGFIMTVGSLEGINTTGSLQGETWSDGDVLYLSPTVAGAITNIKPVAPQHLVVIGYVEYAHQNNGKIYVKIMNGWELGELHDVNTNGATNGQVLTYNGSIWVPSTNGVGTVTSVDMTVPTGLTVSGNPITSSGTLALGLASGYSIPTDANQTNWTAAYNDKINSAAVTGTTTKTLTLNQQDGGTITASWTDYDTAPVTSVFGRTGAVVATSGDYTTDQVTEGANLYFTDARARAAISLTTTGTSGAATYVGGVLNIPQYQAALTNPITGTGTAGQVAYWSGTNTQTGSNNLFWDATNGRLGVGTNAPTSKLTIYDGLLGISNSSAGGEVFTIGVGATTSQFAFKTGGSDSFVYYTVGSGQTRGAFAVRNNHSDPNPAYTFLTDLNTGIGNAAGTADTLNFITNGIERARYTSSGNLLVGTTTDGGQRLQVSGSARIGSTAASAMYWDDTNNRLGIRTTSPNALLEIFNSAQSVPNEYLRLFGGANNGSLSLSFYPATNQSYGFIGSNTIYSSGGISRINTSIGGTGIALNKNTLDFYTGSDAGNPTLKMTLDASGNLGIGMTPSYRLDITSPSGTWEAARLTAGGNHPVLMRFVGGGGGSVDFGSDSAASVGIIRTGGNERVRITAAGNLLIGTTTDSGEKLQVNGRVKSSDFASNNGTVETRLSWSSTPAGVVGTISNHPLEFYTNSSPKMTLSASGNLGIGTASPAYNLHLVSSSTSVAAFRNSAAAIGQILVGNTVSDLAIRILASGDSLIFSDTGKYLAFGSNGATERARFTSGGNLLVGTTTDGGQRLQVNGTSLLNGALSGTTATFNFGNFAGAGARFQYNISNTPFVINALNNNGSAYIGWNVSAKSSVDTGTYILSQAATKIEGDAGSIRFYNSASGTAGADITFTERMRIDSSGNLGIGTTSPANRLVVDVATASANNKIFVIQSSHASQLTKGVFGFTNSILSIQAINIAESVYQNLSLQPSGGNLLVGTTTDGGYKLDVNGTIRGTSSITGAQFYASNTNGLSLIDNAVGGFLSYGYNSGRTNAAGHYFYNGITTELMRITSGGNVLIGTTTDGGYKLDVNGTARVQGDFTLSDTRNIIVGTTTGTKIGTATSQKIGFWNATPIVQPTTAVAAAAFVANTGTAVNDASTFDGYTMAQVVKALRNAGLLA